MTAKVWEYRRNNVILFNIVLILMIIFTLGCFVNTVKAQETVTVRDYIKDKFDSVIFDLYLESMEELDQHELEFIDLLVAQDPERQVFYGKIVYQKGFTPILLDQLKKEVEKKEAEIKKQIEQSTVQTPEFSLPDLPPMKLREKIFAHMVSMQKIIGTTEYNRFSYCGVDPARSERVVKRVKNYFNWCKQWVREGLQLEQLAEEELRKGNLFTARELYHSAAGCYHIGNYINYYDVEEKIEAQNLARQCYKKAIVLYDEKEQPIRINIPYQETEIPGYLMPSGEPNKPLIIFVNVLNNLKEIENHFFAQDFLKAGFNVFNFDGPGQGEMHQKMYLVPDYEKTIHTIIDWFENNNDFDIDMERIGVVGISFGGFFSVKAASADPRIDCVVGNGGFAYFPSLSHLKKLNIPTKRSVYYMTGYDSMKEVSKYFGHLDIKECPPLERPMLIIQGGKDKTVPSEHAYYYMDWATGDGKELLYIKDANHCCQDYFDYITPYTLDWLKRHLFT